MASNACKLLCLILFLAFVAQGYGDSHPNDLSCHLSDLSIKQSKTGKIVQNKPEWEVRVKNPCLECRLHYIKLSCVGFNSVTPIDPSASFTHVRDVCYLRSGFYIHPREEVVFTYVWDTSSDFKLLDADIVCP
ncbi:hypothetical protein EUTSA_v10027525mg [Eutrema salsugineum]|uniref:Uncharacterized protein n=1 Tax=Eutrema salsugineum TaxID=72664 RepID=V4P3H8_EUTSA|nr:uncharacterized protein LOC18030185 [Eutrema salsugineum]ESQ53966.1 hypothetical protein EUTSA_v10027525mg [Eutrema salsugineum]